jgi:ABC-2 type transport system permease protein
MTATDPTHRIELAPSETQADGMVFIRVLGAFGLAFALLGIVAIIANQFGPRFVGSTGAYLFTAFGTALLVYHAIRDGDIEFRRAYTWLGYGLLLIFAITGALVLIGGSTLESVRFQGQPIFAGAGSMIPVIAGLLGLAFTVAPIRHESNADAKAITTTMLLLVGVTLSGGAVIIGLGNVALLPGPGLIMAILGGAFLTAYFAQAGTTDGLGYSIAVLLGALGALTLIYSTAKSVWPTVLFEGPSAIQNTLKQRDNWKLAARIAAVMISLLVADRMARSRSASIPVKFSFAAAGLVFAAVFTVGSFTQIITDPPKAFFVPTGLLLALIGLIHLGISAVHVSESQLVTLTKRELSAFFVSPIVYFIVFGAGVVAAIGHMDFMISVANNASEEPIVQNNSALLNFAAFTILFLIPALTMRTFSEEKRTGTLEVLLTSPVNEWQIVMSKFIAAWLMYMLTFAPAMLYLVALRLEAGAFDYRPLLSYMVAIGVCGSAFVGMGLFFSSLTANQIVAAMLTFVGMFTLLLTIALKRYADGFGPTLLAFIGKFDFLTLWYQSLRGQVPVSQCAVFASLGVVWLFLTAKVLEARKWG